MFTKTLPRYDGYLELHANRTAWTLDNSDRVSTDFDFLVEDAIRMFEEETGVKLYLLGRSGRHACIEDTPKNRKNFGHLQAKALRFERFVIESFNATVEE